MPDYEIIERKLGELAGYVKELDTLRKVSLEELRSSKAHQWSVEHGLQLSVQAVLDIGSHILASIGVNQIDEYADIIDRLGENGILPKDFAEKIRTMAGFRNILVHEYASVDIEQVYQVLQNRLGDFLLFAEYVRQYLSR